MAASTFRSSLSSAFHRPLHRAEASHYTVREAGPTTLWSNIETAWNRWRDLSAPAWHEFGLTATPAKHHIWHLDPHDGPRWRLPIPTPGKPA